MGSSGSKVRRPSYGSPAATSPPAQRAPASPTSPTSPSRPSPPTIRLPDGTPTDTQLAAETHFDPEELRILREEFARRAGAGHTISKDDFREALRSHLTAYPSHAQRVFLERLFDAFDDDGNQAVDFREFCAGLSVFMKGNSQEKLEMSFKMYDVDRDGKVTKKELTRVLTQMLSTMYPDEDPTFKVNDIVQRLFEDLDVNEDGNLTLAEFKLSGLKEPLIMDFLDQFLLTTSPNPRPTAAEHSGFIETRGEMGSIKIPESDIEERSRKSSLYGNLKTLDPLGSEGYRGRRSASASRDDESALSSSPGRQPPSPLPASPAVESPPASLPSPKP
ncbi:hypothetical protein DFJ74DRAFT_693950 [Hyaloraphidium curvatum]|nr:hypothetical protein DFJ74DRAFT_693950 [Hyaloraphidium curvatum]